MTAPSTVKLELPRRGTTGDEPQLRSSPGGRHHRVRAAVLPAVVDTTAPEGRRRGTAVPDGRRRDTTVDPRDARVWLEDQLARWSGVPRTLIASIPAPAVEPEALLESSRRRMGVVWDPPDGQSFAGVGAVHRIRLRGPERFARLRDSAAETFERVEVRRYPQCPAVSPRLYGGLAFAVGSAEHEPWEEFGDGFFSLPRIGYVTDGERAALSLAVRGEEIASADARLAWVAELDSLHSALARRGASRNVVAWRANAAHDFDLRANAAHDFDLRANAAHDFDLRANTVRRVLAVHRPSRREWSAAVEAIRAGIAAGRHQKIVAAGHSRVELSAALETSAVLRRLSRGLRASTRFAFCRRHSTFLGATPERLITRRGRSIATEALAGTIAPGGEGAERLLHSGKDLREHQLVVDQIVRRLGPLCDLLEVGSRPRVRELRDVLHLLTPISGKLAAARHVLELVEELHPTPAVGGVPTEVALRWIREHEPSGRGWYASPVGWFDAAGDGDFAVALRSCVLRGREAFLYAGAGIVRDSDPDLEYTETELKKQALLTALGA